MKKYLLFIFLCCFSNFLKAGEGDTYISASGGLLHYKAMSYDLTFEKTLRYHNAWETGLEYYNQVFAHPVDSAFKAFKYTSILFQGAYKHNIVRFRNSNLRFRGAVGIGVNERDKFTLSLTPGLEYTWTSQWGIQFFMQEKTQFSFWTNNNSWFRVGVMLGFKIPFRFN